MEFVDAPDDVKSYLEEITFSNTKQPTKAAEL